MGEVPSGVQREQDNAQSHDRAPEFVFFNELQSRASPDYDNLMMFKLYHTPQNLSIVRGKCLILFIKRTKTKENYRFSSIRASSTL